MPVSISGSVFTRAFYTAVARAGDASVSLCMENDLPIVVFDMNQPDNIRRAAIGESIGTLIHGGRPA